MGDHADVDAGLAEGGEETARGAGAGVHVAAHRRDQREGLGEADGVGLHCLLDAGDDLVDVLLHVGLGDHDGEAVDAGRQMLDRDVVGLEDGEHLAHEANAVGHVLLRDFD